MHSVCLKDFADDHETRPQRRRGGQSCPARGVAGARPAALAHEAFRAGLYRVSLDAAVRAFQSGDVTTGELAERFDVPRVDILDELERRGIPLMEASMADLAPEKLLDLIDLFPTSEQAAEEARRRLATALDDLQSRPPAEDRAAA